MIYNTIATSMPSIIVHKCRYNLLEMPAIRKGLKNGANIREIDARIVTQGMSKEWRGNFQKPEI